MRLRFFLAWLFLVASFLFFVHGVLEFPWFGLSYGFLILSFLGLAVVLWRPGYELASLLFFALPWSMGLVLVSFLGSPGRKELGLFFLTLLGLCYGFYHRLALARSLAGIHRCLDPLIQGEPSPALQIPFEDEIGCFLRRLDQLSFRFREGFAKGSEALPPYSEKWVISLIICWQPAAGVDGPRTLEKAMGAVDKLCQPDLGFLNFLDSHGCELVFSLENDGADSQAVLAMAELWRDFGEIPELGVSMVLRRCFVKAGILNRSQGDRLYFTAESFKQDQCYLKQSLCLGEVKIGLHESLEKPGSRVFHLGERKGGYFQILREKEMQAHIQNLSSSRIEDKLVSIKVITAHQSKQTTELLEPLLDDVSPRVRMEAVRAMARQSPAEQGGRGLSKTFYRALEKEWNHDIRATLVAAMGKVGDRAGVQKLLGLLDDENDRVRANAIEAVGLTLGKTTILRRLKVKLEDPNNRARANASLAVWLMGSRQGFAELVKMAGNADGLAACSGLYGIGEVFRIENLRILFSNLSNPLSFYLHEVPLFNSALKICQERVFDEHPLVEKNSIIALGKMGSRASVEVLRDKYLQTEKQPVRQWIIEALLKMDEYAQVSELREREEGEQNTGDRR